MRPEVRVKAVSSVLLLGGAVALGVASRVRWARVDATDGMTPMRTFDVKGADWSPWLAPLALVLLAAIALVWALRGWALRALAVLLAVCAVVTAIPAISMLTSPVNTDYAARAIELAPRYRVLLTTVNQWAPWIVLVGAILVAAGAVFALRSASGGGMSTKYRSPAARREELERKVFAEHERRQRREAAAGDREAAGGDAEPTGSERILWDSLDTGVDPTE
ncbi:TIGR02234 family membrane protein [Gordonia sp. (in: high G+C Gram-positive bacteria)]|uniref:TIGR02234 family membrane protein n=1 Tax=Gordonia sp. (in: high G+C Gram-positive bacteria) TaxID=84139 RepID=UPI0039E3ED3C